MPLFDPHARTRSQRNREIHAASELACTAVDFMAAMLFLIGSVLFFGEETQYVATWMFVVGSLFFAMKPTMRLIREMAYLRQGGIEELAEHVDE